jgi:hypothetical protein
VHAPSPGCVYSFSRSFGRSCRRWLCRLAAAAFFERLAMKNKPTRIIVVHSEYGEFTAPGFSDGLNGWCSDKRYAEGRETRREQFFNERKK